MESFIQGMIFGYGAAIPIGPVNVLIMTYALQKFRYGMAVGLGAMSVDAIYLVLTSIGVVKFLNHPTISLVLAIFGSAFLLYMAFLTYKGADKIFEKSQSQTYKKGVLACYAKGFGLNAVNPYIIAFWLSVATFVKDTPNIKFALFGLIFGITSWTIFLPAAVSLSRRFISPRVARYFGYASAFLLFAFAILILYNQFLKG